MTRALLPSLTLLGLAACGSPPATTANEAIPAAPPTKVQQQVIAMPDGQRRGVLLRAIVDAGQQCQGVTGAVRNGEGMPPTYVAHCGDGSNWNVVIGPDGTARVTGPVAPRPGSGQG